MKKLRKLNQLHEVQQLTESRFHRKVLEDLSKSISDLNENLFIQQVTNGELSKSISSLNDCLGIIWKEIKQMKQQMKGQGKAYDNQTHKQREKKPSSKQQCNFIENGLITSKKYKYDQKNQKNYNQNYFVEKNQIVAKNSNDQRKQNNTQVSYVIEKRFTKINIYPPYNLQNQSLTLRKEQIINWIGKLCKDIFSVGFSMLMSSQMSINKIKAYCSDNIIRNLINANCLNQQDVKNINQSLKNYILPYFYLKYPLTQNRGTNEYFSKILTHRNTKDDQQNDLLRNINFCFSYEESGIYNTQIMKFFNSLINLPYYKIRRTDQSKTSQGYLERQMDTRIQKQKYQIQLQKSFTEDMQKIFTSIYNQQNQTAISVQNIKNEQLNSENPSILAFNSNNQNNTRKNIEYKQKVKQYTKYKIAFKLPKNIKSFSDYQIKNGILHLQSAQLLRLVAKWSQQLWQCFSKKQIIIDRQYPFKMKDGSLNYLDSNQSKILHALLQKQKKQIQTKMQQIQKNSFKQQHHFMQQKIPPNLTIFTEEEVEVGMFSASIMKIYQNYLISYLNMLIHSINKATRSYAQFQDVYRIHELKQKLKQVFERKHKNEQSFLDQIFSNVKQIKIEIALEHSELQQIPQLITFKLSDLIRCMFISKQNQVIALYKQLQRINCQHPQIMKIVRLKDRLHDGKKDILINLLYKQKFLFEVQLSIQADISKFISNSNLFCHYLYELQRAPFGPVIQLCNIWFSHDLRSQFYLEKLMYEYGKKRNQAIQNNKGIQKCCSNTKIQTIDLPFNCSICKSQYFECNGAQKHMVCLNCNLYTCFQCQIRLKNNFKIDFMRKILKGLKLDIGQAQNLQFKKQIPQIGGILINLKSKHKKGILFRTIIQDNSYYLFNCSNYKSQNQVQLIQIINKNSSNFQFFRHNIIFSSPFIEKVVSQHQLKNLTQNLYFIPNYLRNCKVNLSNTIFLKSKNIDSLKIFNQKHISNWKMIVKLNLQNNHIKSIDQLPIQFPNLTQLVLSENNVQTLPNNCEIWTSLKIIILSKNKLSNINPLFKIKSLKKINAQENLLQIIDEQIGLLQNLTYLNINVNKLISLPSSIGKILKLQKLLLKSNKINKLPDTIGNLKILNQLNLQKNELQIINPVLSKCVNLQKITFKNNLIQQIPDFINNLKQLKQFEIECNKITTLPSSFKQLQILELNLKKNKLFKFPLQITSLLSLKQLDLSENQLQQLPKQILQIKNLVTLNLSFNNLKFIPSQIGNLKNLEQLHLSSGRIQIIPNQIQHLESLVQLRLNNNKITQIPQKLCNLTNLKYLDLSRNNIKELPEQIENLENLHILKLSENQLKNLPISIGNLYNLTQLYLNNNQLIVLQEQIGFMQSLVVLKVHSNKIRQIPQKIGQLRNLNQLDLSQNKIQSIPNSIQNLQKLTKLNLPFNEMSQLPQFVKNMKQLKQLKINGKKYL